MVAGNNGTGRWGLVLLGVFVVGSVVLGFIVYLKDRKGE
jgi:hypothetical protein